MSVKIERPSEKNLFMAIYKAREIDQDFILVEPEDVQYHKFFTKVDHGEITIDDLIRVSNYAKSLTTIILNEKPYTNTWFALNKEHNRVINFLEGKYFKEPIDKNK